MNKSLIVWGLVLVMGVLGSAPVGWAQEAPQEAPETAAQPMTQAELARLLVNLLGLGRFLPAAPTDQQCFAVLMENNIAPADGWQGEEIVTRALLARLVVQALRRADEIENPDDPQSWIDFLEGLGVSLETVEDATGELNPMTEPIAPNVYRDASSTDPLQRRDKFSGETEVHFGTDVGYNETVRPLTRREVDRILQEAVRRREARRPATPD
ncbi:MAG: hypothetical protein K9N49_08280 [Candidatus Marinimicrobia bacterium]|nr:hypothetical protein [Candidatus Neomarinimicrobiota bacterium]